MSRQNPVHPLSHAISLGALGGATTAFTILLASGLAVSGLSSIAAAAPIEGPHRASTPLQAERPAAERDATRLGPTRSSARLPWRADQVQKRRVDRAPLLLDVTELEPAQRVVMAGDADGDDADRPLDRVDWNEPGSPFAGVCSLHLDNGFYTSLCSAVPISPRHVLTAAHCFDQNDDGVRDFMAAVEIVFNVDGDASFTLPLESIGRIELHPDWTGFGAPSLNDDLCLLTLAEPLPEFIPITPVYRGALGEGDRIELVGYGRSGHGDDGVSVDASLFVKRRGGNVVDLHIVDDEIDDALDDDGIAGDRLELFLADFDSPDPLFANCSGGPTLGNRIETSAAPGDSGGPAFIEVDGEWQVFGINTFINSCIGLPDRFGGRTGGVVANAYLPWIDLVVECAGNCDDCNGNGVPDGVDLLEGFSLDVDGNGRPDECQPSVVEAGDLLLARAVDVAVHTPGGHPASQLPASTALGALIGARMGPAGFIHVLAYDGVHRIDARSGAYVDHFIELPSTDRAVDIAWREGRAYLLHQAGLDPPSVTVRDAGTGALIDRIVEDDPSTPESEIGDLGTASRIAIAPDGSILLTEIRFGGGGIVRFDGRDGRFLGRLVTPFPGDFGFNAIVVTEAGIWAGGWAQPRIGLFDLETGEEITSRLVDSDTSVSVFDLAIDHMGRLLVLQHAPGDRWVDAFDATTAASLGSTVPRGSGLIGSDAGRLIAVRSIPSAGDVTRDGRVNGDDLAELLMHWGGCGGPAFCPSDANRDGAVDAADLAIVLGDWER